jgi:chromosomal replication initiation ATPase DnaA
MEAIQREAALRARPAKQPVPSGALPELLARCARAWGVSLTELVSGNRRRVVAHARAVASRLAVREFGLSIGAVARALGISPSAVRIGVNRGNDLAATCGVTVADLLPLRGKVRY